MPNRILTALLLIVTPVLVFAQSNYKKGYILTLQNDTLYGYINYREWSQNPKEILFKTALESSNVQKFDVQNARQFTVDGYESYERFPVSISMNEVLYGNLRDYVDTSKVTDVVFLKVIQKGDKVHLYSYKDKLKERYYLLDTHERTPDELAYTLHLQDDQVLTDYTYRQQLAALAVKNNMGTASLNQFIANASYSKQDLVTIVNKINQVTESNFSAVLEKTKKSRWFISTGINYGTVTYSGESLITVDRINSSGYNKYKKQIITHSCTPKVSTGLDLFLNPAVQHVVIRLEVSAAPVTSKVISYYKYNNYSDDELENTYSLSALAVSASPQLIYNLYNKENFKFYLGAGTACTHWSFSKNDLYKKPNKQGPGYTDEEVKNYVMMRDLSLSIMLRTGIMLNKRTDIGAIWSNPVEITNYKTGGSSVQVGFCQLSLGYRLGK